MRPLFPVLLSLTATLAGCSLMSGEAEVDAPSAETKEASSKERLADLEPTEQVDPANDEVMEYIVTAVPNVTDAQLHSLYELYTKFRADQEKMVARMIRMARSNQAADRRSRKAGGGGGRGGGGGGPAAGGDTGGGIKLTKNQQQRLTDLEGEFMAAGRALLTPEQYEAWDECAAAVDIGPPALDDVPQRGLKEGSAAPDFTLNTLDGRSVSLSDLKGKPVIVEFGSYTCPIFRGNAPDMAQLAKEHGDDAHFVLVYGYEAHTEDGWQVASNIREGIQYNQPTSLPERVSIAKTGVNTLGVNSTVLIDGMDNAVTDGWEGHPNGAYILDATGKVVSRMAIVDPREIEQYLEGN